MVHVQQSARPDLWLAACCLRHIVTILQGFAFFAFARLLLLTCIILSYLVVATNLPFCCEPATCHHRHAMHRIGGAIERERPVFVRTVDCRMNNTYT